MPKHTFPVPGRLAMLLASCICPCLIAAITLSAQPAETGSTGSIEGRVLNAETGRYIANATVVIEEISLRANTNDYGEFRFSNVPYGTFLMRATYGARDRIEREVTVTSPQPIIQNFVFREGVRREEAEIFELEDFVVRSSNFTTAAEIAIAEERYSPNIKNVVSAEAFGDIPEGNVGEFVKFIPGVLIGYGGEYSSGADATQISVRGFPPHQTAVMIDGVPIANAQPGSLTRAAGLDMLSINNASRVEVTKVPTPDMPSDSIGGSINLISKSAFEYSQPILLWNFFFSANSEALSWFKRTPGPGNERTHKILPGFQITYAAPIRDNFGITFTASSSNQYNINRRADSDWYMTGNRDIQTPDGTRVDARNPFLQEIEITDRPRMSHRHSASIKVDYKPWDGHLLTFNYQRSIYDSTDYHRIIAISPFDRGNPADWGPDYIYGGAGEGSVKQVVRSLDKEGDTHSGYIRWNYNKGPWEANIHVSHSISDSSLVSTENGRFSELELTMNGVDRVNFENINKGVPAKIEVLDASGNPLDYTRLENYHLDLSGTDPIRPLGRAGNTDTNEEVNVYKADIRRELDFIPTDAFTLALKAGVYREENIITKEGRGINYRYLYTGPLDAFQPERYQDTTYINKEPGYGLPPMQWADLSKLYNFYRENPDYWSDTSDDTTHGRNVDIGTSRSMAANNWIEHVQTNKNIKETQDAWYLQLEGKFFNHRLTVVGGMRGESYKRSGYGPYRQNGWQLLKRPDGSIYTHRNFPTGIDITDQSAFNAVFTSPRNESVRQELQNLGITWDRVIELNSLEAAQMEYIAKRRIQDNSDSKPSYSLHTSYDITDKLVARMAYARTFGRIDFEDQDHGGLLANTEITPDQDGRGGNIRIGNSGLEPWTADNWDFSLSYYSDTGGKFAVSYFIKDVVDFHIRTNYILTPDNYESLLSQYGIAPSEIYADDWTLTTTINGEGTARTDGWEFEVSQSLGILADWAKNFHVFGSYTMKTYSSNQDATGALGATSDDFAGAGITYNGDRLGARVNMTYRDRNITGERILNLLNDDFTTGEQIYVFEYEPSEIKLDVSLSYRIFDTVEIYINARNLTNTRTTRKLMMPDNSVLPGYVTQYDVRDFGVQYTFGVRGSF